MRLPIIIFEQRLVTEKDLWPLSLEYLGIYGDYGIWTACPILYFLSRVFSWVQWYQRTFISIYVELLLCFLLIFSLLFMYSIYNGATWLGVCLLADYTWDLGVSSSSIWWLNGENAISVVEVPDNAKSLAVEFRGGTSTALVSASSQQQCICIISFHRLPLVSSANNVV